MEKFAKSVRLALTKVSRQSIPHFRQFIRFLGLPYYFFFQVDWKECTSPPLKVAGDLLYIFFVLRYYPDNYSNCRLYEKSRQEWTYYFGSNYNPFQRGKLFKVVQPPEYQVVFEDKEVCQRLCEGLKFRVPRMVGTLIPESPLQPQLESLLSQEPDGNYFAKPSTGSAGTGVFKVKKSGLEFSVMNDRGSSVNLLPDLNERHILQVQVEQDPTMNSIFPGSLNSVRVLTMLTKNGQAIVISALARFGSGSAEIDNWSAGGIAVGLDSGKGSMVRTGFNKKGQQFTAHPDTGIVFEGHPIPRWQEIHDFSCRIQSAFPYYRLIGLDIAIGIDGPVLIEINAYPDFVGQEQCAGPLLRDPRILKEFAEFDLLFNGKQKKLLDSLST